jgi:NitT/TauT family transport system substrate-binding protein
VGTSQEAVVAMTSGQIDAVSNRDPVITLLQRGGSRTGRSGASSGA